MRSFVIVILSSILICQLEAANYCEHINDLPKKWTTHNHTTQNSCCELTDSQWNLMVWFFLRVSSNLNVTQIVNETESCFYERYVNHILSDLYKYTALEYYVERLTYRKRDQILDKNQEIEVNRTYKWHAKREIHPTGFAGNKFHFRNKLSKKNCIREDEPRYGSVILASNLRIIDDFLNGFTRNPFESKQSHYIILIYGSSDIGHWDDLASSIMTKLWKKHGILDAIILASCFPTRVIIPKPYHI